MPEEALAKTELHVQVDAGSTLMEESSPTFGQAHAGPPEPAPVDFREVIRVSPADLNRILELVRGLLPNLALRLSSFFRCPVELEAREIAEQGAAALESPQPGGYAMAVSFPHKPHCGRLGISGEILPVLIDLALGGSGNQLETVERPLTELEKSLVRAIFEIACEELGPLWGEAGIRGAEICEIPADWATSHYGSMITIDIEISLTAPAVRGRMDVDLCRDVVLRLPAEMGAQPGSRGGSLSSLILARLKDSQVEMEAHLGDVEVRIGDLLALQSGDVLVFDCPSSTPLRLAVNGSDRFLGRFGEKGGRRVVVIRELSPQLDR